MPYSSLVIGRERVQQKKGPWKLLYREPLTKKITPASRPNLCTLFLYGVFESDHMNKSPIKHGAGLIIVHLVITINTINWVITTQKS